MLLLFSWFFSGSWLLLDLLAVLNMSHRMVHFSSLFLLVISASLLMSSSLALQRRLLGCSYCGPNRGPSVTVRL
ncbi:hypothetical protein F4780DRAFT_762516 [Xylariomycetidae sp. FL0641]|nr:hypothetical protein F4780DRAFT_762516 [Xylariomycetidae sp. FL0641]